MLADFNSEQLGQRLTLVAGGRGAIAPGSSATLFVELNLARPATPGTLRHQIDFGVSGSDAISSIKDVAIEVRTRPPLVLGPPLAGGPWGAVHDPAWPRGHRRVYYTIDGRARLPGRYAIDFVKLDGRGHTTSGDPDSPGEAFGYGDPVLAVADGVIVGQRGDMAESARISGNVAHSLGEGAGNYVALRLAGGQVAFYEHLRPGSVRVKSGQRVRRGEVLGALGFSGDTTGPHLHFHLAASNSLLDAEGVPFVFDRFTQFGRIDDMARFGKQRWTETPDLAPARLREWPGYNAVLAFAAGKSAGTRPDPKRR
jgi:hypothetical protein